MNYEENEVIVFLKKEGESHIDVIYNGLITFCRVSKITCIEYSSTSIGKRYGYIIYDNDDMIRAHFLSDKVLIFKKNSEDYFYTLR